MSRFAVFFLIICFTACQSSEKPVNADSITSNVISSDIDLFWNAYDSVVATSDRTLQEKYLKELYFDKGSPGLDGIVKARNYTIKEYLDAINNYPKFWNSVRGKTLKAKTIGAELNEGVEKLKQIYPELKPAKIYLTIGALRTNGTVMDSMLLIGTELAMGDSTVVTSELSERLNHLPAFFKNNPVDNIVPLNIHEYIHTQQNAIGGYDLLSQSVYEGVAEYIPVVALGKSSSTQAIAYGKANEEKVKERFQKELFNPWIYDWIWNSPDNEFGVRDLGYYTGYAMAERYYEQATDKAKAVRDLIQMDYTNQDSIEAFVDRTGYFDQPIKVLRENYETSRPTVKRILEFKNDQQFISARQPQLTIEFSEPMDIRFRSTDFGELGKAYCPEIVGFEFSEDGKAITYKFQNLNSKQRYQFVVSQGYRSKQHSLPLKPYQVNFEVR